MAVSKYHTFCINTSRLLSDTAVARFVFVGLRMLSLSIDVFEVVLVSVIEF